MAYETRPNTGSLFKNKNKETEKHPNMTGKALVDGVWYWVSAWTKQSDNVGGWQSLSFTKMEDKPQETPKSPDTTFTDMDDSIPFWGVNDGS